MAVSRYLWSGEGLSGYALPTRTAHIYHLYFLNAGYLKVDSDSA